MKVLFIAAESAPFIKTGGLGDVIGSLPKALKKEGVDARVVLPLYSSINREKYKIKFVKYIYVSLGWRQIYCGIFEGKYNGIKYYFIDNEQYFNRSNIYGEVDDGERFAFFSKAALEIMPHIDFQADIINANDWHTALSIVYLDSFKKANFDFYINIKSVFSIHNVEFQGKYNPYVLGSLFGLSNDYLDIMTFDNDINLLKAGVQLADRVNTVSESYANELLDPYFSFGLSSIFQDERIKLRGIVNGIDYQRYNPYNDSAIAHRYSKNTFKTEYKVKNKLALQKKMDLEVNPDIPLIGMVGRLTDQKGINIVLEVAEQIVDMGTQLIILGTGYEMYENALRDLEFKRHDRIRSIIMFSNDLASEIYAGSDIYLMPSKSEPCGLSQMIAMRYGSIPIVNRVGGLRDTVEPFNSDTEEGVGFTFESFNPYDMLDAIKRSLDVYYYDKPLWKKLILNAMNYDSSWINSADKYIEMYNEIL
ncbi:MAG: Glycogen synthase [Peptostreptococcus russellii]